MASFVLVIGLAISYPASVTGFMSAPIASAVSEKTFSTSSSSAASDE
jgi:hypothetical protein